MNIPGKDTGPQKPEDKFRQLFNQMADPVLIFDQINLCFLDCNDAFLEVYGYSREEFLNMRVYDLHPKAEHDLVKRRVSQIGVNRSRTNRYTHIAKDGRPFPVEIRSGQMDYKGRLANISTIRDISRNVALENELKSHRDHLEKMVQERTAQLENEMAGRILNETKFRTLFDSSMDAVFLFDRSGFLDCNEGTLKMFGLPAKEMFLGMHIADLSPEIQPCGTPSDEKAVGLIRKAYQSGSSHFEWLHQTYGSKQTFPADVLLSTMIISGKPMVQAVVRDITDLKKAQQEREAMIGTQKEMEIAKNIQTSLLPSLDRFQASGFEISANMTPAAEVGGDYYDVILGPDNRIWFGIGDVTGHGLVSGLIMMMAQVSIHSLITSIPGLTPEDLLIFANTVIWGNIRQCLKVNHHMTISFMVEESQGRYRYAGAHETILIFRSKSGEIEKIPSKGMWLGIIPDISKPTQKYAGSFCLEKGDLLFLYTDGVIELTNDKGEQYDIHRLEAFLRQNGLLPVETVKQRLLTELNAFMDRQNDDISFLIMRKR